MAKLLRRSVCDSSLPGIGIWIWNLIFFIYMYAASAELLHGNNLVSVHSMTFRTLKNS